MGSRDRDGLLPRYACLRTLRTTMERPNHKLATHRQRDHYLPSMRSTTPFQQLCDCQNAPLTWLRFDCNFLRFCRLQHDYHRYLLTSHSVDVHAQSIRVA